jgi:hypothetical protein
VCTISLLMALLALWSGPPAGAVSVVSKASFVNVYLGLPFTSLEFNNPLSAGAAVMGHSILEWRDADYTVGPPPSYKDWTVNDSAIDGNVNEVWLRQNGHIGQTATTVPATILSIHLNGDQNDGIAAVEVDGVEVARLDMYSANGPETALVLVRGLANAAHTVCVLDLGAGAGGADDVAILGAAALAESPVKWDQPPQPYSPTNWFYGWNERSVYGMPGIAADDWVCTTTNPVTKIRWWGSFTNWTESVPPMLPDGFWILMWTDVPTNQSGDAFSHPGQAIWEVHCTNFTWQFVGWDYDPRNRSFEACFLFEQTLAPEEFFYQEPGPTGTNIYWLSIGAMYQYSMPQYPWGWKTRPRDPTSTAPDDAVRIFIPSTPHVGIQWQSGEPIFWPTPQESWDLAFELLDERHVEVVKWEQMPDLGPTGLDVLDSSIPPPHLLADDWLCTSSGRVVGIRIWGSWKADFHPQPGLPLNFLLSIHSDIPTNQSPTGYSMPGSTLWYTNVTTTLWGLYADQLNETFWEPYNNAISPDTQCFVFSFPIDISSAFVQTGSVENPVVYWLDVQQQIPDSYIFGWKTTVNPWNDAATWVWGPSAHEPYNGIWNQMVYMGQPKNLAFQLIGLEEIKLTKWSQPPMPYTPPAFLGWDQRSVYDDSAGIVADDWACTNNLPVTDLHWWGSYLYWSAEEPPLVPDAFQIAFWTDVPAEVGGGFSHPGEVLKTFFCTNFSWEFAGWDVDPRNPAQPPAPEACYLFHQELAEDEWFYQDPANGTNIYWISISAVYLQQPSPPLNAWGWKTRPRDPLSLAPDDAVRIVQPTVLIPGAQYVSGYPIEFPAGSSWDAAFQLTTRDFGPPTDYGDAPFPPYRTLIAHNGASHTIVPGLLLGAAIDAEIDGQPSATATGDDNNGVPDDEDGVVFTSLLVPGRQATVDVTASAAGRLDAWVDFNVDGDWGTAGDRIFSNVTLAAGLNSLTYTVSPTAIAGTNTFARFRFGTAGGLSFAGPASDGEVEDYPVHIQRWPEPYADLGDAPDSSGSWGVPMTAYPFGGPPGVVANFPTVYAPGSPPFGPFHSAPVAVAMLGAQVSLEVEADIGPDQDALNNLMPPADLPDQDGFDNGVALPLALPHCQASSFNFIVWGIGPPPGPMYVNAWFDWNRDGDWNDTMPCPDGTAAPEWAVQNMVVPVAPGQNALLTPPFVCWHPSTNIGPIWMRITLAELPWAAPGWSGAGGDGPPGGFAFGETEDYHLWSYDPGVTGLDFGDAPDPSYPTLLAGDGARHGIISGFLLGAAEDAEADGQPNATATGDGADEDGVVFTNLLLLGGSACVNVTLQSGPTGGKLDAWVDFDQNGSWGPGEQVFSSLALAPGINSNTLCFAVPQSAKLGPTFARFRLSSGGGLAPAGAAQDGEVEDYMLSVGQSAPIADIVITNIVRTTNALVAIDWGAESNVHYQLQSSTNLVEQPGQVWTPIGGEIVGPLNRQYETNTTPRDQYYRVIAPFTP